MNARVLSFYAEQVSTLFSKVFLIVSLALFFINSVHAENLSDGYSERKIEARDAKNYVGEAVMACGTLAQVSPFKKGYYLNIDNPYPKQSLTFTLWSNIVPDVEKRFGRVSALQGQRFCGFGKVSLYKGRHSISINNANHIRLMK